jgi:DNA-binding TFAR19-related protein (PDSD5 family)
MSEDSELEKLKAKRLAEMQQNISSQKQEQPAESAEQPEKKETKNPRDVVVGFLGFRGEEVLQNAENQFPLETKSIIVQLSQLIKTGELNEKMDGGQLLALFRQVGLNIRMNTKINVEQDGKFVSLSDKISSKNNEEQ